MPLIPTIYHQGISIKPYTAVFAGLRILCFFLCVAVFAPVQWVISRWASRRLHYVFPLFFYATLMKMMGFTIRVHGTMVQDQVTLFVANHCSYLDVLVLGKIIPASFVAKSDVSSWPLIGGLCRIQNTVLIERRSTQAGKQRGVLGEQLNQGTSLILFPEGTSTEGHYVLPFKSSLFSALDGVSERVVVQPVSLVCTAVAGRTATQETRPAYAWFGDMTLVPHLWDVFRIGAFTVDVMFHNPIHPHDYTDRKALAARCWSDVAEGVARFVQSPVNDMNKV